MCMIRISYIHTSFLSRLRFFAASTIPVDAALPSYACNPISSGTDAVDEKISTSFYSPKPGMRSSRANLPVPDEPPFKAYIENVPYDIDEPVVQQFFAKMKIRDIFINRFRDSGKPKGCYVQFFSREDLLDALNMDGMPMLNRPVRIKVAGPRSSDRFGRSAGGGRRPFGDGNDGRDRSFSGGSRRPESGFAAGSDEHLYPPRSRGGRYNPEEDRRGGVRTSMPRSVPSFKRDDRPIVVSVDASRAEGSSSPPRERPKLNLLPRSVNASERAENKTVVPRSGSNNPFGDAKPTDTSARLREIEERELARRELAMSSLNDIDDASESSPSTSSLGTGRKHRTPSASSTEGMIPVDVPRTVNSSMKRNVPHVLQRPSAKGESDQCRDASDSRWSNRSGIPGGRGPASNRAHDSKARSSGTSLQGRTDNLVSKSTRGSTNPRSKAGEPPMQSHRYDGGQLRTKDAHKKSSGAHENGRAKAIQEEDDGPKTKVSNAFDVLGEIDEYI